MANALYNKFKEQLLQAGIDLTAVNVKAVLVQTAGGGTNYTFSAAHEFLTSVPAGSRVSTSPNLSGKTVTDGVFNAADITGAFTSVDTAGDDIEAIIYYVDTGVEATSRLICYFDTGGGFPFTTNGNNIDLDHNVSGIFQL